MSVDAIKQHGVHYTPPELAGFLARVTLEHADTSRRRIHLLDPACGDGELLCAAVHCLPNSLRERLHLTGYERDPEAIELAARRLGNLGVENVDLRVDDFLESADFASGELQGNLFAEEAATPEFDVVIANPPYVRTQVLGSERAQELARLFGLKGRVDLYHAFAIAMASVLRPGGVLGLLTSNRFLTIKSGAVLRKILRSNFDLKCVYDLGDTKLFNAAVLPAIVVGKRQSPSNGAHCAFDRVYELRNGSDGAGAVPCDSILNALERKDVVGAISTPNGRYLIERGSLRAASHDETWALHTSTNEKWLSRVAANRQCIFEDVAHVRVGVKTTADDVFIRDDWSTLPAEDRPEGELLKPLITHNIAARWTANGSPDKTVLYPHASVEGKRKPIDLAGLPGASAYLESHSRRLKARDYVIQAGRKWYEIWVPHHPDDWNKPKIVYPDIAEQPTFFLDRSGAIVNGDCYWMTLRQGADADWLYLMLAIANSSFAVQYYDTVFHNKLYAGRRRFMTQYVKNFPLPSLESELGQEIVARVKRLLERPEDVSRLESELNALVLRSFT